MELASKRLLAMASDAKEPDSSLKLWIPLANVPLRLLDAQLAQASDVVWSPAYHAAHNVVLERYMYDKCGIDKLVFVYCDDFLSQVFYFPLWVTWHSAIAPVLDSLRIDPSRVVRCFLQRIPCQKGIKIHRDNGEWIFSTHRVQVPLETHDSVLMHMGATKYNMQRVPLVKGQALELNNAAFMSFSNQQIARQSCIQLIIDYVDHVDIPKPIVLIVGQKLWQSRHTIDVENSKKAPSLPAFIILGAQKCGTTALYEYLLQHPLVVPAKRKECHFFDWRWNPLGAFEGSLRWNDAIEAQPECSQISGTVNTSQLSARVDPNTTPDVAKLQEQYWDYFYHDQLLKRPSLITGEGTPSYLLGGELIARRLYAISPHAKLIVLLRDPVNRAFSHYQMVIDRDGTEEQLKNRGDAHMFSFEELVHSDIAVLQSFNVGTDYGSDPIPRNLNFEQGYTLRKQQFDGAHSYIGRGMYAAQLSPWFRIFPKSQILILKFELMKTPTGLQTIVDRTCHFLNLPRAIVQPDEAKENRRSYASMLPSTRQLLGEFYQPHNLALYQLIKAVYGEELASEWHPDVSGWSRGS